MIRNPPLIGYQKKYHDSQQSQATQGAKAEGAIEVDRSAPSMTDAASFNRIIGEGKVAHSYARTDEQPPNAPHNKSQKKLEVLRDHSEDIATKQYQNQHQEEQKRAGPVRCHSPFSQTTIPNINGLNHHISSTSEMDRSAALKGGNPNMISNMTLLEAESHLNNSADGTKRNAIPLKQPASKPQRHYISHPYHAEEQQPDPTHSTQQTNQNKDQVQASSASITHTQGTHRKALI